MEDALSADVATKDQEEALRRDVCRTAMLVGFSGISAECPGKYRRHSSIWAAAEILAACELGRRKQRFEPEKTSEFADAIREFAENWEAG